MKEENQSELIPEEHRKIIDNLTEISERFIEQGKAVSAPFLEIQKTIESMIEEINISNILDQYKKLAERIQEIDPEKFNQDYLDDLRSRVEKLAKFGWAMVVDVNEDILFDDTLLSKQNNEVDEYILKFYEKNDYRMLIELGEYISTRIDTTWKELVEDTVRLYINGDYKIVIPFAMTLIEAEMLQYSSRDKYGYDVRKDFNTKIESVNDDYIFIATSLVTQFINKIFNNRKKYDVAGELLNRNLVLHGKSDSKAWGKVELLKILTLVGSMLMLDDLFEIKETQ